MEQCMMVTNKENKEMKLWLQVFFGVMDGFIVHNDNKYATCIEFGKSATQK
jgi:hypothetical protein